MFFCWDKDRYVMFELPTSLSTFVCTFREMCWTSFYNIWYIFSRSRRDLTPLHLFYFWCLITNSDMWLDAWRDHPLMIWMKVKKREKFPTRNLCENYVKKNSIPGVWSSLSFKFSLQLMCKIYIYISISIRTTKKNQNIKVVIFLHILWFCDVAKCVCYTRLIQLELYRIFHIGFFPRRN